MCSERGPVLFPSPPAEYAAFQRAEIARWRRVAQAANIVLE